MEQKMNMTNPDIIHAEHNGGNNKVYASYCEDCGEEIEPGKRRCEDGEGCHTESEE